MLGLMKLKCVENVSIIKVVRILELIVIMQTWTCCAEGDTEEGEPQDVAETE